LANVRPLLVPALVGLLPVLGFLGTLLWLDSYKLVKLRTVVLVVAGGALTAGASYLVNGALVDVLDLEFGTYSRTIAPLVEELLKALVIVGLIAAHRIGFLVDAAIFGFAVGTGFALVENLHYLHRIPDATLAVWIVRGFGTAIMHGGATALFAVIGVARLDRQGASAWKSYLAGLGVAVALHMGFNQGYPSPTAVAVGVMALVPAMMLLAFDRSEKGLSRWLGRGFDADAEMLALINAGNLSASPVGQYLHTLRDRFDGPVVADLLCYLRLYTELALRAKGVLLMRENGFPPRPIDEDTRARFAELHFLEKSIGATGLRALQPLLHMERKELWQLYMLEAGG
jgi:RsiW-degrading membrane proteinase PrsW (M82 family)